MPKLRNLLIGVLGLPLLAPSVAAAASLKVTADGFANGRPIPPQCAVCLPAPQGHVTLGHLSTCRFSSSPAISTE